MDSKTEAYNYNHRSKKANLDKLKSKAKRVQDKIYFLEQQLSDIKEKQQLATHPKPAVKHEDIKFQSSTTAFKVRSHSLINDVLVRQSFKTTWMYYLPLVAIIVLLMFITAIANKSAKADVSTGMAYAKEYITMFYLAFGALTYGLMAICIPSILLTKEINDSSLAISLISNNSRSKVLTNKIFTVFLMYIMNIVITSICIIIIGKAIAPIGGTIKLIYINCNYWVGSAVFASLVFCMGSWTADKRIVYGVSSAIEVLSIIFPVLAAGTDTTAMNYISMYGFNVWKYAFTNSPKLAIGYCVGPAMVTILITLSFVGFKRQDLNL